MKNMENIKFETAIEQLENIANDLEKGDLDLENSILKFEEGIRLSKKCNEMLENAEKKIDILLQEDGKIIQKNFIQED